MSHGMWVSGEVRDRVWARVRAGEHLRDAAQSCGVSYEAARKWLADCGGTREHTSSNGPGGDGDGPAQALGDDRGDDR